MALEILNWKTFGHSEVLRYIKKSVEQDRLSHAYLFTGPDRVGKTTVAIDLACLINAEHKTTKSGNVVVDLKNDRQAIRIRKGFHSDVKIINNETPCSTDGTETKSRVNISIEHIQDIKKEASLKPFEGEAKVFIIEGAQNMTLEASNALLKILEEPYDQVFFVLTTSSTTHLPETIISRCQVLSLRSVKKSEISENLSNIYGLDHSESDNLSSLSRGRPGWAVAAVKDATMVDSLSQLVNRVSDIMSGSLEERFVYARKLSNQFRTNREEVYAELDGWIDWFREISISKNGLEQHLFFRQKESDYLETTEKLSQRQIVKAINLLFEIRGNLKNNAIPRLALEVLMVELPFIDKN
ncbi:hypothetical protein M1N55_02440 [Dehalococcoidia bacterium]|nr:hypothetical protein [Dehalococcoidia bacterium]